MSTKSWPPLDCTGLKEAYSLIRLFTIGLVGFILYQDVYGTLYFWMVTHPSCFTLVTGWKPVFRTCYWLTQKPFDSRRSLLTHTEPYSVFIIHFSFQQIPRPTQPWKTDNTYMTMKLNCTKMDWTQDSVTKHHNTGLQCHNIHQGSDLIRHYYTVRFNTSSAHRNYLRRPWSWFNCHDRQSINRWTCAIINHRRRAHQVLWVSC